ncbi:polysaccharide deacetylase family protein [Brevibacillus panacihumi]|uniref:Chitooligosaccharide deacetylase n=1 Tax=Brevibacillus panacihumi TaxID=497735 RepID=A0A3M8CQS9_9BACL|nr:polysaccharide deacetylase family protein [Brevibacillus panacihumi]RNB77968.1 chitooligosaccharide deacetylase [Brevibacillus panacihumi]
MNKQLSFILLACLFLLPCQTEIALAKKEKDRDYYEARGEIVWEVPTNKKVIALTFDDGPDPVYTRQIAELLKQYKAKATFFVVGSRVKAHPGVIQQLAKDKHELANHTYTHPDLRRISPGKLRDEVLATQQEIFNSTGIESHLFRPPGGYYSESLVNVAKETGYLVVLWSWHQDTRDWSDPGVQKIVDKVLNNARNGDIVLFHDYGGNRKQTVDALRMVLPELQKRGYEFITVSEMMKLYDNTKKVGKD